MIELHRSFHGCLFLNGRPDDLVLLDPATILSVMASWNASYTHTVIKTMGEQDIAVRETPTEVWEIIRTARN